MPTRILIPVVAFTVVLKFNEWHSTQRRFHQHNFKRGDNNVDTSPFGLLQTDKPRPRFIRVQKRHQRLWDDFLYNKYLFLDRDKKTIYANEEDLKKIGVPTDYRNVMISRDDILLKMDVINGRREKQRYDFNDLVELPWYYKRWQKRTKEQFDQEAKDYAATNPAVYGTPYWPGIKSSDL